MKTQIRDYLYLDIDRVRSIFAQASGGVVESIRQLQEEARIQSEEHEKRGESIGESILLGSGRIATQVLHDYLFTLVEDKLGETIVEVSGDSISNVSTGTLCRITGKVEIDDIERMHDIMENYNELWGSLLAVGVASEIQDKIWKLQDELQSKTHSAKEKGRKKEIERLLEELEPENVTATILRENRRGISPLIPETFKRVYGLLYKDIFEVKIITSFDETKVFRGIVNKQHLREDPTIIYAKYGTRPSPSVNWTMVGQVATVHFPGNNQNEGELLQLENDKSAVDSVENNSLRDSYENLYATVAKIEEHIIGPGARTTWVVTPLAIYHETV